MIETAERDGILTPGCTILEPTSGNTGVSLAFVAKLKGYKVTRRHAGQRRATERTQLLRAYGAEIVYSDGASRHQRLDRGGAGAGGRRPEPRHALPVRQRG